MNYIEPERRTRVDPGSPLRIAACLVAFVFVLTSTVVAQTRNVVMIVADDMGYADSGITGVKDFETPHIDSISRDGVFLRQAYVTAAVCSPSRAGFLTGRYQQRFGHEHNGGGGLPFGLPLDQKTMADHFKAAGFATGAIGKWHLGQTPDHHPMSRGFDEFVGHLGGGHPYYPESDREAGRSREEKILDGREPAEWDEYLTDYFGDRAVDFIERHADEPFFLYLSFNAPHTPMQAKDEDLEKVTHIEDDRRRKYAAMMIAMDRAIGKTLQALDDAGVADETTIVFFSDNGGPRPGDPSVNGSQNWPYRSGKAQYFEGGVRVPMFLKVPGVVEPGTRYNRAVSSLDLLPTLLASVGKTPLEQVELDGVNLLPYLTGEKEEAPHERIYFRTGAGVGVIEGDYKMVVFRREQGLPDNPERPDLAKAKLFNLADDPEEKNELSTQMPDRFDALIEVWKTWDETLGQPLWGTWESRPANRAKAGAKANASEKED